MWRLAGSGAAFLSLTRKGSQVSLAEGPVKKTLLISSQSLSEGAEPRGL